MRTGYKVTGIVMLGLGALAAVAAIVRFGERPMFPFAAITAFVLIGAGWLVLGRASTDGKKE